MNKYIGNLQKDCLTVSKQLNPVLKKIEKLDDKVKATFIKQNSELLFGYAKSAIQIVQVFQYEEYYSNIGHISNFIKKYEKEPLNQQNINEFFQIIHFMIIITDRLIQEHSFEQKKCCCCENHVYYLPLSSYYAAQVKKYKVTPHIFETLSTLEYTCPCCGSSDRDRLMISMLKKLKLHEGYYRESLLQIAPASAIEHWINGNCPSLQYDSTDLFMENVTFTSDIQDMKDIADKSYDYIICSHVLEHVQDDRKAMRELFRILKQNGFCLFLVPIALDMKEIDEEWGLSEEENWRRFGQNDHCRTYAKQGLLERLQAEGFTVHALDKEFFGEVLFHENGFIDTSVLYVLTKEDGDIQQLIRKKITSREQAKENHPLVSVLMSAYNHEKYVGKTIESVLDQTYQNFEFLIADDYSTDHTVEEILKYEDRIDEIHVFDENGYVRLDFLSQRANGKYIAIINSDDMWEKEKLEKQVFYMENHPEVAACFTGGLCIHEDGTPMDLELFLLENKKKEEWMRYFYYNGNCLAHPSVLIKREIYNNMLQSSWTFMLRQLPDFWMWMKLIQKHEIHVIEKELIRFRFHESGTNMNTSARTAENGIRHANEECYLWYDTIKKMDNEYFLKSFRKDLINKSANTTEEILCEKFFVLNNSNKNHLHHAALFFLYDVLQDKKVISVLKTKYHFSFRDIYKISGTW